MRWATSTATGRPDLAAGAPGADRAYVFSGATRALLHTITDPQNKPGTAFGFALANVGDVDADGVTDLAVGARGVDQFLPLPCPIGPCNAAPEQGRAFVFSGATGALLRTLSPGGVDFLAFGFSLAGLGDVSGDGVPDIAVGRPDRSSTTGSARSTHSPVRPAPSSGSPRRARRRSRRSASRWRQSPIATATAAATSWSERSSMTPTPGAGTSLDGRAYLLSGATGAEIRHIENPLGAAGENFGLGLTPVGDQTGDGSEDDAISDPGAARVHLVQRRNGRGCRIVRDDGRLDRQLRLRSRIERGPRR